MDLSKEGIRRANITARTSLNIKDWAKKSAVISEMLESALDWSKISKLHIYEPISTLGEVDIGAFVKYIRNNFPSIKLYTSRQFIDIWHVVQLDEGKKIDAPKLDVVIVPMLGFDTVSLNRIGYGGGYYDKFLVTQTACKKIGVCFEQGKVEKIPAEPHDIPMDYIVTEKKIYS